MTLVVQWWHFPLALFVVGSLILAFINFVMWVDYQSRPDNFNEWLGDCKLPVGLLFAAACALITGLLK